MNKVNPKPQLSGGTSGEQVFQTNAHSQQEIQPNSYIKTFIGGSTPNNSSEQKLKSIKINGGTPRRVIRTGGNSSNSVGGEKIKAINIMQTLENLGARLDKIEFDSANKVENSMTGGNDNITEKDVGDSDNKVKTQKGGASPSKNGKGKSTKSKSTKSKSTKSKSGKSTTKKSKGKKKTMMAM